MKPVQFQKITEGPTRRIQNISRHEALRLLAGRARDPHKTLTSMAANPYAMSPTTEAGIFIRAEPAGFNVTFEITTAESAEHGEAAERGFVLRNGTLREAIEALQSQGCHVEADRYPPDGARWATAYRMREDFTTGETENRSIHFPESLTNATRRRILRLLDAHGAS